MRGDERGVSNSSDGAQITSAHRAAALLGRCCLAAHNTSTMDTKGRARQLRRPAQHRLQHGGSLFWLVPTAAVGVSKWLNVASAETHTAYYMAVTHRQANHPTLDSAQAAPTATADASPVCRPSRVGTSRAPNALPPGHTQLAPPGPRAPLAMVCSAALGTAGPAAGCAASDPLDTGLGRGGTLTSWCRCMRCGANMGGSSCAFLSSYRTVCRATGNCCGSADHPSKGITGGANDSNWGTDGRGCCNCRGL